MENLYGDCDSCLTNKGCSFKNVSHKCPCNICLVKTLCNHFCDNYKDFINEVAYGDISGKTE